MKAVVLEHHGLRVVRIADMAGKTAAIGKRCRRIAEPRHKRPVQYRQSGKAGPAAAVEWQRLVKEGADPRDHLAAAHRVIAGNSAVLGGNGIGSVECIIQAAETRICGIQRITRIGDGNDKLRPGDAGDLRVHLACLDLEIFTFRDEVADLAEERGIGVRLDPRGGVVLQPTIDLRLHGCANRQQLAVARRQAMGRRIKPRPEGVGRDVRSRKKIGFDKSGEFGRDGQAAARNIFSH